MTEDIAGEPVHEIYVIQVGTVICVTYVGIWTYKMNKTSYRWEEICIHMYWQYGTKSEIDLIFLSLFCTYAYQTIWNEYFQWHFLMTFTILKLDVLKKKVILYREQ